MTAVAADPYEQLCAMADRRGWRVLLHRADPPEDPKRTDLAHGHLSSISLVTRKGTLVTRRTIDAPYGLAQVLSTAALIVMDESITKRGTR